MSDEVRAPDTTGERSVRILRIPSDWSATMLAVQEAAAHASNDAIGRGR